MTPDERKVWLKAVRETDPMSAPVLWVRMQVPKLLAELERMTAERDEATEGEFARAVQRAAALAQVQRLREALLAAWDQLEEGHHGSAKDTLEDVLDDAEPAPHPSMEQAMLDGSTDAETKP